MADVVTLLGVVAIMLWMDWRLALVTYAIVPVLFGVAGYSAHPRARRLSRGTPTAGPAQRLPAGIHPGHGGDPALRPRGARAPTSSSASTRTIAGAQFASTTFEASLYATVEALGSLALALLLWYGGGRILAGALTFGGLVAFIQYTNRFFLPIRDLGAKYTVMQAAMASAERIYGLLVARRSSCRRRRRAACAKPGRAAPPSSTCGSPTPTSAGSCPTAASRSRRASTSRSSGTTGEGKSTCVRLLNRTWDVQRGRVLVDGIDVREWDLGRLRRHVGVVFQDPILFTGTIAANLSLDGEATTPAQLARALQTANAATLLAAAARRVSARNLVERAANLSHGERQLLAIARALVYNPAILVLDEATSSVDPESERMIREAMARLMAGRTTLTIAHRLSTIHGADRILVLHRGRIHEEGTHAALLRHGGLYARLWEMGAGSVTNPGGEGGTLLGFPFNKSDIAAEPRHRRHQHDVIFRVAIYRLVRGVPRGPGGDVRSGRRVARAAALGARGGRRDGTLPR